MELGGGKGLGMFSKERYGQQAGTTTSSDEQGPRAKAVQYLVHFRGWGEAQCMVRVRSASA